MGLLRSLITLLPLMTILCSQELRAQSSSEDSTNSARSLDALLQDYAYRAFVNPRTGQPYTGDVPSNLTGIKISAMRLRSGSLRSKGVKRFEEFEIPLKVLEKPYVERLILVYQNLGNWSLVYYPLPGYTYLTSVLGLLAYNASNLTATSLQELDTRASEKPILINFRDVKSAPEGSRVKCVLFNLNGSIEFNNVVSGHVCSTFEQGHFSIVVRKKKNMSKVWKIIVGVVGGILLLIVLGLILVWLKRYKERKKMEGMEREAEGGEELEMRAVGDSKAPVAIRTRTQPVLEKEYVL